VGVKMGDWRLCLSASAGGHGFEYRGFVIGVTWWCVSSVFWGVTLNNMRTLR
jgi:hypothetical protein